MENPKENRYDAASYRSAKAESQWPQSCLYEQTAALLWPPLNKACMCTITCLISFQTGRYSFCWGVHKQERSWKHWFTGSIQTSRGLHVWFTASRCWCIVKGRHFTSWWISTGEGPDESPGRCRDGQGASMAYAFSEICRQETRPFFTEVPARVTKTATRI